jgi:hypothetical protein
MEEAEGNFRRAVGRMYGPRSKSFLEAVIRLYCC